VSSPVSLSLVSLVLSLGDLILTLFLTLWLTAPLTREARRKFKRWIFFYLVLFGYSLVLLFLCFLKRFKILKQFKIIKDLIANWNFSAHLSALAGIFSIFLLVFSVYLIFIRTDISILKSNRS
jgi:hypothetical protein